MRTGGILAPVLVFALLAALPPAQAQAHFMQCSKLSADQQEQADFCATHLSCRIAVNLLKSCADFTEAIAKFRSSFSEGKPSALGGEVLTGPAAREREQARVDGMADADRQAGYKACVSRRGDSGKDFCFEAFASSEQIAQRRNEEKAKYAHVDVGAIQRDSLKQYLEDDRALAKEMQEMNCPGIIAFERVCSEIANRSLKLQRNVQTLTADMQARSKAGAPALTPPALQSRAMFSVNDVGLITYFGPAGGATEKPAVSPGTAQAAAGAIGGAPTGGALAALLPTRAPGELDGIFSTALLDADAEAMPREAQERQQRDQQQAQARASAAAAAEAESRKRRLEAEFAQTLQTGDAGQLFALADQLDSEGQHAHARQAFRALVARFPQHPLAINGASRLTTLAQADTRAAASSQDGAAGGNVGSGGTGNRSASTTATGPSGGTGGTCAPQKKAMENEFNQLNSRRPAGASITDSMQLVMYMTSKSLALAAGACKGQPDEAELSTGMQAAFDAAKKNCTALSTAPDTYCVPRAPW